MDACYGNNLCGSSWADAEDDEFDIEVFKVAAASFEYYSSPTPTAVKDETTAADNNCPTIEEEEELFDDDDLPPRPSTPEPGAATPNTSASECDPSSDDAVTKNESPAADGTHPSWCLPGDRTLYLQVPYPYCIPLGFHPYTLHWLECGKPGKPAYPELLWEAGGYSQGWRTVKEQRGWKKDGETMLYFTSPLRQEVKSKEEDIFEDEEEFECDLANEAGETEVTDLSSTMVNPYTSMPTKEQCTISKLEKRDSVHDDLENQITELFSEDDHLRPTSLALSVIVSTDEEIDLVGDLPITMPVDDEHNQVDGTMEERIDPSLSTPLATTTIAPNNTLNSPTKWGLPTIVIEAKRTRSTSNVALNTSAQAGTGGENLCRRLNTLYRIHHASKKHCRRFGSGILHALAQLPMA